LRYRRGGIDVLLDARFSGVGYRSHVLIRGGEVWCCLLWEEPCRVECRLPVGKEARFPPLYHCCLVLVVVRWGLGWIFDCHDVEMQLDTLTAEGQSRMLLLRPWLFLFGRIYAKRFGRGRTRDGRKVETYQYKRRKGLAQHSERVIWFC